MGFWERTWAEREDEVRRRFGPTEPPDTVTAFSWDDIRVPGACALTFPPVTPAGGARDAWHKRDHWLYATLGLTQPLDEEQVERHRDAGNEYSGYGFELGILTDQRSNWPIQALYLFMSHATEGLSLNWGDRFAFGLRENDVGDLEPFTGRAAELGITPANDLRAMLFWPYLLKESSFVTSTGKALIYIATGITEDEWEFAKATTTAHLLLLLVRAGIGQRTIPCRKSLLEDDRWNQEVRRIRSLGGEQAYTEIELG